MFSRVVDVYHADGLRHLLLEVAHLEPRAIAAAVKDSDAALARWQTDPGDPVRLTGQDAWSREEIVGFLREPVELCPELDDGDTLPHLIACLKAHRQVVNAALRGGLDVVHARSHAVARFASRTHPAQQGALQRTR